MTTDTFTQCFDGLLTLPIYQLCDSQRLQFGWWLLFECYKYYCCCTHMLHRQLQMSAASYTKLCNTQNAVAVNRWHLKEYCSLVVSLCGDDTVLVILKAWRRCGSAMFSRSSHKAPLKKCSHSTLTDMLHTLQNLLSFIYWPCWYLHSLLQASVAFAHECLSNCDTTDELVWRCMSVGLSVCVDSAVCRVSASCQTNIARLSTLFQKNALAELCKVSRYWHNVTAWYCQ